MNTLIARVRRTFAAAVLPTLGVACGAGGSATVPPSLVLPVPPGPPGVASKQALAGPQPGFAPVRDRILGQLLAEDPSTARGLGLHEYDGKVPSASKAALAATIEGLNRAAEELARVDASNLSDDDALDLAELKMWVGQALFTRVDVDAPHKTPQFYGYLFGASDYIDCDYAPLEERAKVLLEQEESSLAEVAHVRENLTPPLSKPVAEVAARNYAGYATYLRGDVARIMGPLGDDAQRRRFAQTNEALARAASELSDWLKKEAARGDQSHVLGPARYAKLLLAQEGLSLPLSDFERMNEDNLAANKKAYEALASNVKEVPLEEAKLFSTAGRLMRDARKFVVDHSIVTLASNDEATVRETPPYERWNPASIEPSGPFEKMPSAFFQLTIPDRSWPSKERQAYLGTEATLRGTTVHEVYPGHFVQGRWSARATTRVQKAFQSYSFVEGWAHYSEQMMVDEGFARDDAGSRSAMLKAALLRNCRFAASVGIHVKGMTVEQAAQRFVSDCHQGAASAREQAVRGTFDPGYFAYTLGKLQIMALRDEARQKLGPNFSLQRFHDALLSHGSPPVALIHDRVLRELGATSSL